MLALAYFSAELEFAFRHGRNSSAVGSYFVLTLTVIFTGTMTSWIAGGSRTVETTIFRSMSIVPFVMFGIWHVSIATHGYLTLNLLFASVGLLALLRTVTLWYLRCSNRLLPSRWRQWLDEKMEGMLLISRFDELIRRRQILPIWRFAMTYGLVLSILLFVSTTMQGYAYSPLYPLQLYSVMPEAVVDLVYYLTSFESLSLYCCLAFILLPTAGALAQERETGTLEALWLTRLRTYEILGGKILAALLPVYRVLIPAVIYCLIFAYGISIYDTNEYKFSYEYYYPFASGRFASETFFRIWPIIGLMVKSCCAAVIGLLCSTYVKKSALAIGITSICSVLLMIPWPESELYEELGYIGGVVNPVYYSLLTLVITFWLTVSVERLTFHWQKKKVSIGAICMYAACFTISIIVMWNLFQFLSYHDKNIMNINNYICEHSYIGVLVGMMSILALTLSCLYLAARRLAGMRQPAK